MAQETYEICLDGDGFRIIPVTEDQVRPLLSSSWQQLSALRLASRTNLVQTYFFVKRRGYGCQIFGYYVKLPNIRASYNPFVMVLKWIRNSK
jgi:hypothetical protein